MTVASLLLVVLAAFIHAGWNLLAKRGAAIGPPFVFAYTIMSGVLYAPWFAWVLWTDGMQWSLPIVACLVLSGALHLAYSLCLQRGYRVADLSVVYPVARGSGPALSAIGAFVLLGEVPTAGRLGGLALVVSGIALIAAGATKAAAHASVGAGIRWGLATGGLIASYTVVDAWGVKVLAIAPVVLDWVTNSIRVAMISPWLAKDRRWLDAMRGHWGIATLIGGLAPLSYILVLTGAPACSAVSVVAPMREMSMMVAAVLGFVLLREPVGKARATGCVALAIGVVVLTTG